MNALIAFAALMGAAEPALPHHAQVADGFALLALLLMLRRPSRPNPWAALYVGWTLVSAYVHQAGGWKVLGSCELVCVFVLAGTLDDDEQRRLVRAWVLGAAVLAIVALGVSALAAAGAWRGPAAWAAGGGELGWSFRPKGLAASTNLLASLCLLPFLVAVAERRWKLAALFGVTLLTSRTALAAAAGVLFLRKPRGWRWGVAALVLAAVASMYLDVHGSGEAGIRWRIAGSALRTALSHPLFGVGPGVAPASAAWPAAGDAALAWDAHSTALDVAATLGVPALVLLAVLWWGVLRRAEGVLLAVLGATMLDALTLDVEDFRHVWLLLGLAWGAHRRGT